MILSFMEYNMNSQSPLFRQQVLTLFKKVILLHVARYVANGDLGD